MSLLKTFAVGLTAVAACGVAAPAVAWTSSDWAPSTTPLAAKEGTSTVAKSYGTWNLALTSNGTRSHGYAKLYDNQNDGNPVYSDMITQSNAGICYAPEYTSCSQAWYDYKHDETERHYNQSWSASKLMTTAVNPYGSWARARVHVCEDNNFGDPCSGWGYSKRGNKY